MQEKFDLDSISVGLLKELILNYQKRKEEIEQLLKEAQLQEKQDIIPKLQLLA